MLRGLYEAGWSLQAAALNQELVADNMAHATTPGYRRQGLSFGTLLRDVAATDRAEINPNPLRPYTSFEPGPWLHTESPLDLALSQDVFFVVEGPQGPLYTRAGVFELNPEGELQARNGLRVQGQGGNIVIPPGTARVSVGIDGSVYADGAEVGRLRIVRFDSPDELRRAGTTLFAGDAPRDAEPGSFRVEQGYREAANVNMVEEMIAMMLGMRQYEAAERSLRALNEAVALNTRPQ